MTAKRPQRNHSYPTLKFEKYLWSGGLPLVAGLDEAGRGCWAGPVCAAVVILPPEKDILKKLHGVRDSKQMTALQRKYWSVEIKSYALSFGIGFSSNSEIDRIGIVAATRLAMLRALDFLTIQPNFLLLDYMLLPTIDLPQASLVKGDVQSLSIAAASVLAKTERDRLMVEIDSQYPGYGFTQHKGYGTSQHQQKLKRLGASPIHRFSFAPVRDLRIRHS